MSILQEIQQASIIARKLKLPTATFLVTLYSESANVGKNKRNGESTDEEVQGVLRKFKAGAEVIIKAATQRKGENDQLLIDQANIEISILNDYLPSQMSVDELTLEITKFVDTLPDRTNSQKGKIMAHLKTQFPDKYDGKVASELVSGLLS